jgi:hypothetical protein
MRTTLMLALALSIASLAGAATVDPAEAWRPMHSFIGTWKGTRAGAEGTVKVTRVYSTSLTNHHVDIIESGGGRSRGEVLGQVSLDSERQVLVLHQIAADGSASDAALDPPASSTDPLVFLGGDSDGTRTRITYERTGAKSFIERIERSAGGESFSVVSETRFVRAD